MGLSSQTIARIPFYVRFFLDQKNRNKNYVSVQHISSELDIPVFEINDDLELFNVITSSTDIYNINYLISSIERTAGLNRINEAFVIGTGNLLEQVLSFDEFKKGIIKTIAVFTNDVAGIMKSTGFAGVLPIEKVGEMCGRMKVKTGVLAVEEFDRAEEVFRLLVASGIRYIINFSSFRPDKVQGITVLNCRDLNCDWFQGIMPLLLKD